MSKEKQIDMITELLIDFDEMGFIPTTTVPDPEAYAIEWRNRITEALRNEFEQLNAENETLRICLKDQRGRNAELQKLNKAYAKQCEEYEAELNQMHNLHADVVPKSTVEELITLNSQLEATIFGQREEIKGLETALRKSLPSYYQACSEEQAIKIGYEKGKSEAAREIFEEIESVICVSEGKYTNMSLKDAIAILKKKYTE